MYFVTLCVVCVGISVPHHAFAETVPAFWHADWDSTMAQSKLEQKPVIVNFVVPACPACNKLYENTLSNDRVINMFEQDWVGIRVDLLRKEKYATIRGDTINYIDIPDYFGAIVMPTLLFFDNEQNHVGSLSGYIDDERFVKFLDLMKNEEYELAAELKNSRTCTFASVMSSIPFISMSTGMILLAIGFVMIEKRFREV